MQNMPRRDLCIGGLEHYVARARIVVPAAARRKVRRTQFPLAQRIVNARFKAALLFLIANFQPVFDELDALVDDGFFDLRAKSEEVAMLFLRAETHDIFHTSAV